MTDRTRLLRLPWFNGFRTENRANQVPNLTSQAGKADIRLRSILPVRMGQRHDLRS